jgi:hypothetical protein
LVLREKDMDAGRQKDQGCAKRYRTTVIDDGRVLLLILSRFAVAMIRGQRALHSLWTVSFRKR